MNEETRALKTAPVCEHHATRYACFLEGYVLGAKEATDSDAATIQMLMRKIGETKNSPHWNPPKEKE